MSASKAWLSVCVLVGLLASTVSAAVNIESVPVANPNTVQRSFPKIEPPVIMVVL